MSVVMSTPDDDGTETEPIDGTPLETGGQHDPREPSGSSAPPPGGEHHPRESGPTPGTGGDGDETTAGDSAYPVMDDLDFEAEDDDAIRAHLIPHSHVDTDGAWVTESLLFPCRALLGFTREQLLNFEARGAAPSLRACGFHNLE